MSKVRKKEYPRVLPLEEAARELGMPIEHLTDLVQSGRVPVYLAPNGETMMVPVPLPERPQFPPATDGNGDAGRPLTLDEINARLAAVKRENFAHLEGVALTLREAEERFGIPAHTIYQWARKGYVRILRQGTSKAKPTLVNAADVAYCAKIRQIREEVGILKGSPLLDENGRPHLLRRPLSLVTKV